MAEEESGIDYRKEDIVAEDIVRSWSSLVGTNGRMKPEALASLPGGKLVISDSGNKCVKVFTVDGIFIGLFANKGFGCLKDPRSLTTFPDGTVAVFDAGDKAIKLFSMAGGFIRAFSDEYTASPVPLASSKEGDVVFPYKQTIRFLSIRNFSTHILTVNTNLNLSQASGITVSQNHVICCGMSEDDVIFIDRHSGLIVATENCLQNPRIEPGLKPLFYGICLDKEDNVYIADADNNRIVFIQSPPMETVAVFDCEEWMTQVVIMYRYHQLQSVLLCPKFVCAGPDGGMFVLEHLGKVKMVNLRNNAAGSIRTAPRGGHEGDEGLLFSQEASINDVEVTMQALPCYRCC